MRGSQWSPVIRDNPRPTEWSRRGISWLIQAGLAGLGGRDVVKVKESPSLDGHVQMDWPDGPVRSLPVQSLGPISGLLCDEKLSVATFEANYYYKMSIDYHNDILIGKVITLKLIFMPGHEKTDRALNVWDGRNLSSVRINTALTIYGWTKPVLCEDGWNIYVRIDGALIVWGWTGTWIWGWKSLDHALKYGRFQTVPSKAHRTMKYTKYHKPSLSSSVIALATLCRSHFTLPTNKSWVSELKNILSSQHISQNEKQLDDELSREGAEFNNSCAHSNIVCRSLTKIIY